MPYNRNVMPYRNKTYVSFDGDNDIHYYRLMQAWKQNDGIAFNFYNAHDLNTARDSSQEESIKRQLSERMRNSADFILLVGERTRYLTKFVQWEIEQAAARNLPMIVVNLNGRRSMDRDRCPLAAQQTLAVHIPFNATIMQYALDHWPTDHSTYTNEGRTGPFYFKDYVYNSLGL